MPAANPVLLLTSGVKSEFVVEAKEAPALIVNCASALKGRRATAAASSTGAAMRDMGATSCVGLPKDYDTHAAWTSKPDWRCCGRPRHPARRSGGAPRYAALCKTRHWTFGPPDGERAMTRRTTRLRSRRAWRRLGVRLAGLHPRGRAAIHDRRRVPRSRCLSR